MTALPGHPGQNGVNVHLLVEEEPVLEKENVDYQTALKYQMGNAQMVSREHTYAWKNILINYEGP